MKCVAVHVLWFTLVVGWARTSTARQNGIEASGCSGCHRGGSPPRVTISADSATVAPGQNVTLTIAISTTNGQAGGFFLPRPSAGAFSALGGTKVWADGGVSHAAPGRASGNQVVFQVVWTAPAQASGGVDFPVWAISANGNGSNQGDEEGSAFTSLAYGCGAGTKYYADRDSDGYGTLESGWTMNCTQPAYYAVREGDCDDSDPKTHPGAIEACDGKDNDCNGTADEGLDDVVLCEDKDGDGHGILGASTHVGCAGNLRGFGACDGDCNDEQPAIFPGAAETCNGADDDCDGRVDEDARPTCGLGWCRRYGVSCASAVCTPGKPRAEQCNSFDDDCNGVIDNGTDLELCGTSLGCRAGYCVPIDDGGTGTGDTPGSTGGTINDGGARPVRDNGGGPSCAMGPRSPSVRSALGAFLLALGCAERRRRRAHANRQREHAPEGHHEPEDP